MSHDPTTSPQDELVALTTEIAETEAELNATVRSYTDRLTRLHRRADELRRQLELDHQPVAAAPPPPLRLVP